ncbi:glucose-6-phosphate isomerase [Desulfuribacillus alkaliarsenatis]|uniref:Glucose-6-phosphate isomerase n=1 Tax=Desulfuribacillus alkaliarsenatis TaxID=766136 RepID=A0A1E5FZU8_9FIRM|nr:glucose-6-phosphate isomerase [Desulfuribacillus alkaliarsenatis]OEF96107.1 glucose-6-phosphate isomerase [Desulfuribacillus alkaliarsenatis]
MSKVSFEWNQQNSFVTVDEVNTYKAEVASLHKVLHNKTGAGNEFLGWLDWYERDHVEELQKIEKAAKDIQGHSEVLVVIGVGGSYIGARAVIETLQHTFYNELPNSKRKTPRIFFVGNHVSSTYLSDLIDIIEDFEVSINVISKSGTTTEPAIAFRVLKDWMEKKYGKAEAARRIFVTTDKEKGALKTLALKENYETFVVPDDVGGRYSVLTAVGLLPISVAGINIQELIDGAVVATKDLRNPTLLENDSYQYAVLRNILNKRGKSIELLAYYEPNLNYFAEWWKQLFGESEGKDGKGIFPASVGFSTDLHSLGQYIQDGHRHLFETALYVEKPRHDIIVNINEHDLDELNYLAGQPMSYINQKVLEGTTLAHTAGNVPNLKVTIPALTAYHVGYLIYFFMKSCAMSGYLLGVNPFDQPGVEEYKKNMFALLGKPGYENRLKN